MDEAEAESSSPSVDIGFTAAISEQMTVPRHIRLAGQHTNTDADFHPAFPADSGNPAHHMRVPDRILVTGGEHHVEDKGPPPEISLGPLPYYDADRVLLSTPPSTLTLRDNKFPSVEATAPQQQRTMPNSSNAPEWFRHMGLPTSAGGQNATSANATGNPVEELALLKRQLQLLGQRVFETETAMERQHRWNAYVLCCLAAYFGMKLLKFLRGVVAD